MYALKIGKHKINITHGEKILFPKSKITKDDLVNYYKNIASIMVPHMKDRPLMMHRFIEGIGQDGFFQKNVSDYFPKWIKRVKIAKKEGGVIYQALCNNAETLVYIVNQLCITPHIWPSRIDKINYPDKIVFDLDPSGKDFAPVMLAAKKLKKLLENLGLKTFVKTTGSKGLHIIVPIKRENKFEYVRKFTQDVAKLLVEQNPKILTTEIRKEKRENKIFVDTYRNSYAQTSVAPYAVRAKEKAPIATPLYWHELNKNLTPTKYNIKNIFDRLDKIGDPWEKIFKYSCSLKNARKKLDSVIKNK